MDTETRTQAMDHAPTLAQHAANRMMFGAREGDVERIERMGFHDFLDEQLTPDSIDDSGAEAALLSIPHETLSETMGQLYDRRNASPSSERARPIAETRDVTFTLMVESNRQLYERMVNFWHEHFNVYGWESTTRAIFPTWDAIMRRHALGNFLELLIATAQNACMLRYLDNYLSTSAGPNENYAREMIELHTMGVMNYNTPSGYSDEDVYEASRCFTGWSYNRDSESAERGLFQYNHNHHDRFQKIVLGLAIPRDQPPLKDGLDVLEALASHPGTARHVAWKLCRRFISDAPPDSIVESTAEIFHHHVHSPDQIKQTLRHLFSSEEFQSSRETKFKRPLEWIVSMMRSYGLRYYVHSDHRFEWLYDSMGQQMFGWITPDGPADYAEHWRTSNGLLRRWRLMLDIANDRYQQYGFGYDAVSMTPSELRSPVEIVDWWIRRTISGPVSSRTRDSLIDFMADGHNPHLPMSRGAIETKTKHLAGLCAITPEFMLY